MYSRKVINKNLAKAESIIATNHNLPSTWVLEPPSDGEREEMRAHFKTLLDSKGYLVRDLTKEERLWILVESTICKLDFYYFSSNYGTILNWSARPDKFNPNIAQGLVLEVMAIDEEVGLALWYMFLKARQLGLTTLWQMLLAHRVFCYRHVGAYTGSSEEPKSKEMVEKLIFIWENMDWWIRPRRTVYRAGELVEFGDLNSSINVQWGNQKGGIGRGATPTIAHLSEVSTFLKPEDLIDSSLVRAMHENPFSLFGMESTANVLGDWWHRTWDYNTMMDARGLARFKPIFLPWYVGSDLYPTEWGYKRRPCPHGWVPPEYVRKHALAAKRYVAETPMLKKALGNNWEMSTKQMWWYYLEYEEAREGKKLHILLRELPASADEAFQNANPSIISLETLSSVRSESNASVPSGVFQISGDTIPFIYSDNETTGDPVTVNCYSQDNNILESYKLGNVRRDSWPDPDPDLKLFLWEWPKQGETYGIYCDPSEGVGQDNSVIGVIKKATPWHPDEQVAEWASNKVAPHDLWAYIYCLAHLYTVKDHNNSWQEPLVVIETNISAGDAAQTEMLKRGWSNFYRQADFTQIGEIGSQYDKRPRAIRDRIGWRTDRINRPRLLSLFRKLVRDGNFKIRSPYLVKEMATLEYNLDKQRIEAAQGKHDDRVMAPAILLCSWYDPEVYGSAPTAFIEQRQYESALEQNPSYMGDTLIGRSSYYIPKYEEIVDSRAVLYT